MTYYKDRDFAEIKKSKSGDCPDIFPVSESESHINAIIDELNNLYSALYEATKEIKTMKHDWNRQAHYWVIDRLAYERDIRDHKEAQESKHSLVREIDVIISGEEGAAKQASLCDLVGPIAEMKLSLDIAIETLERIAAPTYGTELCNTVEENETILSGHFWDYQYIAKEALKKIK